MVFRIRFHGRGGQGLKTASRILGTAFFIEGFEVQDAPRYGAERRGAPIFAFVRADKHPIHERGVITNPDLVVVADDSLIAVPAAGVLQGITEQTVMLILSHVSAEEWQQRLNINVSIIILPAKESEEDILQVSSVGTICTAAAAALVSVISKDSLMLSIQQELASLSDGVIAQNLQLANGAYDSLKQHDLVKEKPTQTSTDYQRPDWIDVKFEKSSVSGATIRGGLNSVEVKTGLWRTMRPVINYDLCNRCWWVCSSFCPDSAINLDNNNYPQIDYDHCKGCLICVAQCPPHAITAISEAQAQQQEAKIEGESS